MNLHRLFRLNQHTCPWWFAYTFDNPLRRLVHNPREIFDGLVKPGDTVVDIGCGLGYFSLALAELVGPQGHVIAVDVQSEMLRRAQRRAQRRGLADRIRFHQSTHQSIGVSSQVDFVLNFWMLHEVRQRRDFLTEIHAMLQPSGHLLIAEPKGHVPDRFFAKEMQAARDVGFTVRAGPEVRFSRSAVCTISA
jgi:ubiquinone/menaquinone biosynthesis C-methylase UbiE